MIESCFFYLVNVGNYKNILSKIMTYHISRDLFTIFLNSAHQLMGYDTKSQTWSCFSPPSKGLATQGST